MITVPGLGAAASLRRLRVLGASTVFKEKVSGVKADPMREAGVPTSCATRRATLSPRRTL